MTFARVDDVAAELGRDIAADGTEAKQITKWLRRAEMLIRNRIPVLDEWCKDENYRDVVVEVESAAVARKALNPEGVSSTMLQIDDGNMQTSIDSSRSHGEISILDEEWDMLLKRVSSDLATAVIAPEPVVIPLPHYPYDY